MEPEAEKLRRYRAEAEAAASTVETAWRLAGLPSTPYVMPVLSVRGVHEGPHVSLGGCHASAARTLADVLTQYARLAGLVINGESNRIAARMLTECDTEPALTSDGLHVVRRESSASNSAAGPDAGCQPPVPALGEPALVGHHDPCPGRPGEGTGWGRSARDTTGRGNHLSLTDRKGKNMGKRGGGSGDGKGGGQQDDSNKGAGHGGGGSDEGGNTSDGSSPAGGSGK